MLGLLIVLQIFRGFLISFSFIPRENNAFISVFYLQNEVYFG
jgi:quinol-cytochrome oxidoreductase complex cytochrome b subunit